MKDPRQILLVIDVAQVADREVHPFLSSKRSDHLVLRLSEESGRRTAPPGAMAGPYDWPALGRAVESLAEKARGEIKAAGEATLFIAGRAPLPLFVHLGYLLNKFIGATRVLNPYRGGPWTQYSLVSSQEKRDAPFFDVVSGLGTENPATGWVAVYVSTIGAPAPKTAFLDALKERNRSLAGIVEIRTSTAGDVTPESAPFVATELVKELPRINDSFPNAEGMALFVAGPVPLAFAAGCALNFHAQRDIWVMNYDRGGSDVAPGYEVAMSLPFRTPGAPVLRDTAEDREKRREALDGMIEGIEELRNTLQREDFPSGDLADLPRRYLDFLGDLRLPREPEGDAFALSLSHRELRIGRGLLESMRHAGREELRRFGQLLLLHELYHDGQDLRTSNYAEIGRAGVVLEEVDFWADVFALSTLIAWDLRQGGPRARVRAAEIAAGWIDTAIAGIEAFDRFEHGECIERLFERRLRRYLIWHLQHERALAVRAVDDIGDLFRDRLFVELAPLEGTLDARGDKLVKNAVAGRTEIFVVRKGHLVRRGPGPGFEPSTLVDAVRRYDRQDIRRLLHAVVENHRHVLVPWTVI